MVSTLLWPASGALDLLHDGSSIAGVAEAWEEIKRFSLSPGDCFLCPSLCGVTTAIVEQTMISCLLSVDNRWNTGA
jgi:hypothetical protein